MQRFIGLRPLFAGLFALFCTLPSGYAQLSKHGLIWHFGNHAGLDFTSGVPIKITDGAMDSYEGCASYCDANGKLLFYSNGGGTLENNANGLRTGYIWNRNNAVMYDMGQTQGGGYSSAQGVVILPKPSSPGRYYQFMVDQNASVDVPPLGIHRGLSYFEIDMSLNGGLGGVVGTNITVFKPAVECLTAVPKPNSQDFWVITVDHNSQDFVVVPVTPSGIGQPQMQQRNHLDGADALVIKVSPDGRFLCAGHELYTFNSTTGTLQFLEALAISNYTFSFSPNSQYLYGFDSDDGVILNMVGYDLLTTPIAQQTLTDVPIFSFPGLMQLAPDGNIYFVEQLDEDFGQLIPPVSLSIIRCPDSPAPQLERAIMKFPTDINNVGGLFTSLPNFADYIFASPSPHQDTIVKSICLDPIILQPNQIGTRYQWSTGATTAQITVTAPGTYSVVVEENCSSDRTTFLVQAGGAEVVVMSAAIPDSCQPFPLTLRAVGYPTGTYLWPDGNSTDSLVINEYGEYVVQFNSVCGMDTDTFRLSKPQQDCCHPLFPNAFTPNGDNINDRFSPIFEQCEIEFADFFIYDRWGELVFQSYNPAEQWDGLTLNGTISQPDVYTYTLLYKRRDQNQEHFEKGQVTLLR